jgi:hypothetical protein
MADAAETFVAECFWPGVSSADVDELDRRVRAVTAEIGPRQPIQYLGSILIREDEVVFCQFEGDADAVRETAERAGVPFDRILATRRSVG